MKPSTVDLYLEKEEKKKEVVQIPPTLKRDELHTPGGPDDEESSSSSDSSKEEQEPQPQSLRRSTQKRWQLKRFGYSMLDSSCIFTLIANTNESRMVREAMGMHDVDSWMEAMNEEMVALKNNATWCYTPLCYYLFIITLMS